MSEDKRTYRLYALPLTVESIEFAVSQKYSRITPYPQPGYALIYTDGEQPKSSTAITSENEKLLSEDDVRWLAESGAAILAEEAQKEQPEMMKAISDRIEALEAELAKRSAEIAQERE